MSNNSENETISSNAAAQQQQNAPTQEEAPTPTNNNNVISIASKQINDVINFQEPTTSKNYSFKTEIRINILGDQMISERSSNTDDSVTLNLFDENLNKEKETEAQESYVTIDPCVKEKTTATTEPTIFSRDDRTQRIMIGNTEAPPPYDSRSPPPYSSTPQSVYRQQTYATAPSDPGGYPFGYDSPSFLDLQIRHFFIKKVFFILSVQLLITTCFISLVMFHKPTRKFVKTSLGMSYIMLAMWIITYVTLMCCEATRRIFPLNFILLFLFTIAMSYTTAVATVIYSTQVILVTAGSTGLICFVVSLLACQTKFDITKWAAIIALASIIVLIFGFITAIVSIFMYVPGLWLAYSAIATVLFTVFLLYDMQLILGGRRYELSPEEYIFGALTLYVDILLIFMYLLNLVGGGNNYS